MFQNFLNRRIGGGNGAGISLGALASGIPFLLIAGKLLFVWIAPAFGNGLHWIKFVVGLAVLEFVIAHSGIFMGSIAVSNDSRAKRIAAFAGIGALYSLFAVAFSFIAGGFEIIQIFVLVMVGRFITIASTSRDERALLMMRAVISAIVYFGLVMVTTISPMPRFGITREIAHSIDWGGATGLWITQPHRPIAMLTIYFLLLGCLEIWYFGTGKAARSKWNEKLRSRGR